MHAGSRNFTGLICRALLFLRICYHYHSMILLKRASSKRLYVNVNKVVFHLCNIAMNQSEKR